MRARAELLWGYAAQGLTIGAGLILLPVVLRNMSSADVGMWFVFMTLANLVQLLDLGFLPTFARNTAYVYSGARSLRVEGLPQDVTKGGAADIQLLACLVSAARRIYMMIACVASPVLIVVGSFYIMTVVSPSQDRSYTLVAWLAFCVGHIANFYFGYFNGLLQGRGDIVQASKAVVVNKVTMIGLGATAVAMGYGLLGLGLASATASMVGRYLSRRYFLSEVNCRTAHSMAVGNQEVSRMMSTVWHNASRLGAVQVGAFLIQRASTLIAASFVGLDAAASYSMTMMIFIALGNVSGMICYIQVPRMSGMQVADNRRGLGALYGEMVIVALVLYLLGAVTLLVFGDYLMSGVASSVPLLPTSLAMLVVIIQALELNHSLAATYLTTTNFVPFVQASILSGIAICLLGAIAIQSFGLLGLIAAQGTVQLAYNNWKWPAEVSTQLGMGYPMIIRLGAMRIGGIN